MSRVRYKLMDYGCCWLAIAILNYASSYMSAIIDSLRYAIIEGADSGNVIPR